MRTRDKTPSSSHQRFGSEVEPDPGLSELVPPARLRRLELAVNRRLDGLLQGEYRGLLPGVGSEIAGSRAYRPGEDEVRRMDWAVTARTGLPHVREMEADRELTTWLLVDATPSMDFGTATLDKKELSVAAVATIGFLTAGVGNRLGAVVLTTRGLHRFPARAGRSHLFGLLRALLEQPRGDAAPRSAPSGLADALTALSTVTTRRGLVVVVSDFLDGLPDVESAGADWERPLRRLAVRHQVLAVEVTDPREWELPDVGVITLVDPETGRRREVCTSDPRLRDRFAQAAAQQREQVRHALRRCGASHLALRTDRDWTADIARHVRQQRRLAYAAPPQPAAARGGTP